MHRDSHSAARGLAAEAMVHAGSAPAPAAAQPCLLSLGEASGQFPNLFLPCMFIGTKRMMVTFPPCRVL